jgi:hypothetical protein
MEKETKIISWEQDFFVRYTIILEVTSVELVSDRKSYIVLRDRWRDIVWNVHVPSEVKGDDSKDSFYEELEQVFDHFPKVPY